jgi:lipoic acid synthetase
MILGDRCTRRCHYCAVQTAKPLPPAEDEPQRLAQAVAELGLAHVVITAVSRDDLPDAGAAHYAACVRAVRAVSPATTIEVLPADFQARRERIALLVNARPDLYNHNLEMVARLTPAIRPQGDYERSLAVLRTVKALDPGTLTKSGVMVGLGETWDELIESFGDLRTAGCDVLTIGQYLQPTREGHWPVKRFYAPEEFDRLADAARALGFLSVAAGPFVRSSYNAAEVFAQTRTVLAGAGSR